MIYSKRTMAGYTVTKKDTEMMLHYLSIFHPENANEPFARELLYYMRAVYRRMALTDPDALSEMYDSYLVSRSRPENNRGQSN